MDWSRLLEIWVLGCEGRRQRLWECRMVVELTERNKWSGLGDQTSRIKKCAMPFPSIKLFIFCSASFRVNLIFKLSSSLPLFPIMSALLPINSPPMLTKSSSKSKFSVDNITQFSMDCNEDEKYEVLVRIYSLLTIGQYHLLPSSFSFYLRNG